MREERAEYITIELEHDKYFVARRDDDAAAKRRVRCSYLDQAWEVAERMSAAHGNCEIRNLASVKLWIDDLREPPDDSWYWVKTSQEALLALERGVTEISFDHDLGGDDTAMPVAQRIEQLAYEGAVQPIVWHIHSANPVGRKNLQATLESAERYWQR